LLMRVGQKECRWIELLSVTEVRDARILKFVIPAHW
jgi:hypothetical protein